MRFVVHPDFDGDVQRFAREYAAVYANLGQRFQTEARDALLAIKSGPGYAGHLVKTRPTFIPEIRRCNLRSFPFFVLYGLVPESVLITSLIPSHSDPLTWFVRLRDWPFTPRQ